MDVINYLAGLWDWINTGIYDFFVQLTAWVGEWLAVWWIKYWIWKIAFAWEVVQVIMVNFNVSAEIALWMGFLPPAIGDTLAWVRIPEAINIIASAFVARLGLRMVGLL